MKVKKTPRVSNLKRERALKVLEVRRIMSTWIGLMSTLKSKKHKKRIDPKL